ncbi:MAG: STAS domain-containing protein [Clostridia bacterium]|nr:STAS domain-containing protein [Clostridia bacterium]
MEKTAFELNGTSLTVKPVGELDSMTSPIFEEELRRHLPSVRSITVDFAQVDYISSAGLRVFLAVDQTLENQGAEMKLIHVNENIMEIFELVGFLDVVTVE